MHKNFQENLLTVIKMKKGLNFYNYFNRKRLHRNISVALYIVPTYYTFEEETFYRKSYGYPKQD